MKKFQFIPKLGKIVNTNNINKIIDMAAESSLISELKDWLKYDAEEGEYFEGEFFEIIRIE